MCQNAFEEENGTINEDDIPEEVKGMLVTDIPGKGFPMR
jgi:hypothetical protein